MNSVSEDVKDMLVDNSSLGLEFAVDLFIATMPATPDNVITLYDTGGRRPSLTYNDGEAAYKYNTLQIMVRNNDYKAGYDIADQIYAYLNKTSHILQNGSYYSVIIANNEPELIGRDDSDRFLLSMNFEVQRFES
jgi:hypothetical protein